MRAMMKDVRVDGLRIGVLGPLTVRSGSDTHELTQRRVRQLLAVLAHSAPQPCPTHEIADQLWTGELPDNPRQAVQIAISRLRTALGEAAGSVRTCAEGYQLDDVAIDAHEFVAAIRRAGLVISVHDRIKTLESALHLWRGSPLADIESCRVVDRWVGELEEARHTAHRLLSEGYLSAGRFDDAVDTAQTVVDADATDEHAAMCLSSALARRGNKTRALRVLDRLRSTLRSELGVDLSPAVLELERDILHGSVDLDPFVPSDRIRGRFVGRELELLAITDDARPALVIVSGSSGGGKSELLREASVRIRARGGLVVACEAQPRSGRPLEPVTAIVHQLIELGAANPSDPLAMWAGSDQRQSWAPSSSRDELVGQLSTLIAVACGGRGIHVLVDDAQWLDRTSAAVFGAVAQRGDTRLTVFTRPDTDTAPFWDGVATPVQTISIQPFGHAEIMAFLAENHPHLASDEIATRLLRRSGGNPLYLSLLADGLSEGTLVTSELPVNLLMAAAERLGALPPKVQRTLEIAAVAGDEFDVALVAELDPEALANLITATQAGLIGIAQSTGAFTHGLIGEAARQLLPPVRRIDLHDAVGTLLERRGAPPAAYAHHYEQAAELDRIRAASALLGAGDEYMAVHDHEGALELFERAHRHVDHLAVDDHPVLAATLLRTGSARRRLDDPAYADPLIEAARIAGRAGIDDVYFDAVVELCQHGRAGGQVGDTKPTAIELLTEALGRTPPPEYEARLCAAAATVLAFSARGSQGRELFTTAWATAESLGDDAIEASVLMSTHLGLTDPDDLEARMRAAARLAQLAGADPDRAWECAFLDFGHGLVLADRARVDAAIATMRRLHAMPKAQPRDFGMAFCESAHALLEGRLDAAENYANQALTIGMNRYSPSWAFATYAALIFAVRDAAGQTAQLISSVRQAVHELPATRNLHCALAYVAALNGDTRTSRSELRSILDPDPIAVDRDLTWSGSLFLLGRAAAIVGDERAMVTIRDQLAGWTGRMSLMAVTTLGPIDVALAELEHGLGDNESAADHLMRAETAVDSLRAPVFATQIESVRRSLGGVR